MDPYPVKKYLTVALIFFAAAFLFINFGHSGKSIMFHPEIIPTNEICYIKDEIPVPLPDGDYPLAMPPGETFVKGIAPMMLVKVNDEYYPLNIADDSILPRLGKQLPLKILFGFTSPHAENTLPYLEKTGGDPAEQYRRFSLYYLHVGHGYGKVQRVFEYKKF